MNEEHEHILWRRAIEAEFRRHYGRDASIDVTFNDEGISVWVDGDTYESVTPQTHSDDASTVFECDTSSGQIIVAIPGALR